ncbi:Phosphatidylserine/phosphatidylglycerophosphate / cardiolipin synthase-like protein [uncultured Mycobacterium sp.]|uniref:phospholipase D n=1 Tax=uncultured Mycobacterium sp. TaxID=171292 RepID=A0A1Y5PH27_9MYCO|nr:Phosphatidylserine/phosphatidylglycerophosphate / cardiolipin synthase-like protein [uncultured Mycobacterium sp.]
MTTFGATLARALAAGAAICTLTGGCAFGHPTMTSRSADPAAPYQLIQEPDDGYEPILNLIRSARHSVQMTMYQLSDPDAVDALVDARRRGLDVKVILDAAYHGQTVNTDAYGQLRDAGVDVIWAPNDVIYHQKSVTVDDTTSAVGTGNLTARYYATSRDAYVVTTNPADVAAISATFTTDFTSPPAGRPPEATPSPRLVWSPDARAVFLQRITSATQTLDITSEELKDRAIVAAIDQSARRGVACRIVLTENPAWARSVAEVSAAGCSVHLMPDTPTGLYMHEKILLTDDNLIIGSHNLSTTSLLENRELSLQLDTTTAPDIIAAVRATFDRDYRQAPPAQSSTR